MKRTYSQRIASYVEAELANEGPGVRSCVLPLPCHFVVIVSIYPASTKTTEGAREWPGRCAFLSVFGKRPVIPQ
ncbi:MAG: hypothetical protein ACJARK_002367 [Marinobacter psychrophilus]|jgi:hypothetical protein